ncbi:MAG: 23S rRNA (uracil(1939)-C(5))-methyltransferase RlmD [Bacteroidales bacterium]|nr:23S rRNA (uracil(1939)-C(5))-methyltransferase RlmD [Bacteroidales bacterium]
MHSQRPVIKNIQILDIHSSGNFIATFNEKKYYIPKVITNEIADIQIQNRRLGYRTGKAINIVEPSQNRVPVYCPYYENCGGCNFLHIQYQYQLKLKQHIIQKAFEKYNISYNVPIPEESNPNVYYRNKATFDIHAETDTVYAGFHPFWSKEVIHIKHCLLLNPQINELHNIVIHWINQSTQKQIINYTIRINTSNEAILILKVNQKIDNNHINVEPIKNYFIGIYAHKDNNISILHEKQPFSESVFNLQMNVHPLSFLQNHIAVAQNMIQFIKQNVDFINKIVFDLYCGMGFFSLLASQDSQKVIGIDSNPYAINDAKQNAKVLGLDHHSFINGDVLQTFNSDFLKLHPQPDIIILDPPRSGTLIEILKTIIQSETKFVIYVSCNPVSLAWNLTYLLPYYSIKTIKAFDMFPQTHQVETVVILQRAI